MLHCCQSPYLIDKNCSTSYVQIKIIVLSDTKAQKNRTTAAGKKYINGV